uniref:Uncharacterized protein n=1 Tax=Sphaerodactylus townsendi TaxID=933632 RepID=A0ACB8FGG9_9SAUR
MRGIVHTDSIAQYFIRGVQQCFFRNFLDLSLIISPKFSEQSKKLNPHMVGLGFFLAFSEYFKMFGFIKPYVRGLQPAALQMFMWTTISISPGQLAMPRAIGH